MLAGAVIGVRIAPSLIEGYESPEVKVALGVSIVIVLVALGETLGVLLGRAVQRRAVVVELQSDTDHFIALRLEQRGRDGGIDAARHGDNDPDPLRRTFQIETVQHRNPRNFRSSFRGRSNKREPGRAQSSMSDEPFGPRRVGALHPIA